MLSDGTWNYTWQHGRELASMTDGSTSWNFTYNADGLRTGRSDGITTYKYFYIDGKLSHMLIGSSYVHFAYDTSGSPIWMRYNGTRYYYVTNLQGDVITILDANGNSVVQYNYDAWGKVLSITGSMADTIGTINPLLYRGYIYDHDAGLYYLQSRYYNPTVGRFINADDPAFMGITGTLVSFNLFPYCENNPVNLVDPTGRFGLTAAIIATGAIVGGLLGAFNAAATGGNILESVIEGALTGAIGATCGMLITNPYVAVTIATAGSALVDFATQATNQVVTTGTFDIEKIDGGRIAKTAFETGLGTAIPQFGDAANVAADAFGTALIWAEGSTIITTADVIITNSTNPKPKTTNAKPKKYRGVSILDRELLIT